MTEFNEPNVQAGVKIVQDFAIANGVGQDRSDRPYSKGKTHVNTDLIINSLVHTESVPVTREDVAEIKRRVDEWKASVSTGT